eukprot:6069826-Alexandrium_andersonii.AAC.1
MPEMTAHPGTALDRGRQDSVPVSPVTRAAEPMRMPAHARVWARRRGRSEKVMPTPPFQELPRRVNRG